MELCQNQNSPQKDVAAPNPDTAQHISFFAGGYSNQDLPWAWQPHCLDSSGSESSFTDEEQQMHKMLCCPITKVTGQLHCSCPCSFQGAMCLKVIFQSLPFCCKYGTIVHDVVLQARCTDICGSCADHVCGSSDCCRWSYVREDSYGALDATQNYVSCHW